MDTFSPEFSKFWVAAGSSDDAVTAVAGDDDQAQRVALEELAERVSAARSII